MRSLSSTLLAEQKSPTHIPVVKVVLTHGGNTYTYTTPRLLSLSHSEEPYRHSAEIQLDNSDNELTTLDLKGYKGVISYGYITSAGDEFSAPPPLWVVHQELYSAEGKLTCQLKLLGIPNLLAYDRASASYIPTTSSTKTVKTLLREIAGDSGVTLLACFNHCNSYEVVFDSEDSLIDTYQPKDGFRVYVNGSRLAAIRRLLDYTKCVMRVVGDGSIHVLQPTTTGTSYDYEYTLETGHTFFSKAYRKTLVLPNYIVVMSNPDDSPQYSGYAQDAGSVAAFREVRQYKRTRLPSNATATAIAEANLSKHQLNAEMGSADVPMNCGAELFDYVKVTDARQNDYRIGNIGSLTRLYKPPHYTTTFSFGGWLSVAGLWSNLEVYPSDVEDFGYLRLAVKNLYVENIDAVQITAGYLNVDRIQAGSITNVKILTVAYAKITNVSIDTADIESLAVTNAKIDSVSATKITTGTLDADRIAAGTINTEKLHVGQHFIENLTFTDNSPSAGYVAWSACQLYYDGVKYTIASGNTQYKYIYWNYDYLNSTFRAVQSAPDLPPEDCLVAINRDGEAHCIRHSVLIDGASIIAGTLDADRITGGTITAATIILSGVTSILKSSDYVSGTSGWQIKGDGAAEFNEVTIRGTLDTTNVQAGRTLTVNGTISAASGDIILDALGITIAGIGSRLRFKVDTTTVGYLKALSASELYLLGNYDLTVRGLDYCEVDAGTQSVIITAYSNIELRDVVISDDIEAESSLKDIGDTNKFDEIHCVDIYVDNPPWDEFDDLAIVKGIKAQTDNPNRIDMDTVPPPLRRTTQEYMSKVVRKLDAKDEKHRLRLLERIQECREAQFKPELDKTALLTLVADEAHLSAALAHLGDNRAAELAWWQQHYDGVAKHEVPVGRVALLLLGAVKQAAFKLDELIARIEILESRK